MFYFGDLLRKNSLPITEPSELRIYTSILLINQQIHHEAKPLFYKNYLPKLQFMFYDIPTMQSFLRVIGRHHLNFKGHIRLIAKLDDDASLQMKAIFTLIAKQVSFGDDVDAFIDILDEVAETSSDREDSDPFSTDAFMLMGEDWEVELRHVCGNALDMMTYYEYFQLDGDIGRLE
ncbi:hypothetical protein AOQ84DRAFT_379872 [Glonium stellatum]|uniref:Uncharacterized protein n=1 Tax=Glonium stellatum TaxID=574774 RepID=A0A8E2EUY6_9PEZI|nr:hypothetical protein AOQ84DRAFT_379872 [Glonium stellatum]